MITQPHPGTVAFHNPEPELVTEVRTLVSRGVGRKKAVTMLISSVGDRPELEAAHIYWIRQMPRFAWDDYTGNRVLMILEDVLRNVPRGS